MYLLDTNTCIYIIKNKYPEVVTRLRKFGVDEIKISAVTVAELQYGIEKSQWPEKNRLALAKFLLPFDIIPFSDLDAEYYGRIRSDLEKKGMVIGPYDMMIAAQGKARGLTIVTNNVKEFNRVAGLGIENWVVQS